MIPLDWQRKNMKAAQRAGLLFETATFFTVRLTLTATCQGQRLRALSIWLKLFKEIVCYVLIFIFHKLNDITTMTYKIVKQIIWPWLLTLTLRLTFDLDDLKKTNCFKIGDLFEVTWRKNVTSYVKSETTYRMRPSARIIFKPTRSLYDFRFKSYDSKDDFHGYWCVWPWPWHLKVIWFLSIHFVFPCMTGVNFEAICSLIAEI